MLFVVSSAFCGHGCVFMRVSSWWRAVSVHGVYAGGKCDPSQPGLLHRCLSTALHNHLIPPSSFFYDRQLREGLSNYLHLKHTPLPLYNWSYREKKNTLVGTAGLDTVCACSRFTNQNFASNQANHLGNWAVKVHISPHLCWNSETVVSTSYQINIHTSPLPEMIYKLRVKQQASSDNNPLIFI